MTERVRDLIAIPATGVSREWLTEVELEPADGVPVTSFLVAENTLSAEKVFLTGRITVLDAARMSEVCRALARATGC